LESLFKTSSGYIFSVPGWGSQWLKWSDFWPPWFVLEADFAGVNVIYITKLDFAGLLLPRLYKQSRYLIAK